LLDRAEPGAPLVPVAAFDFAHDGPHLHRRAPNVGEHSDEILREIGLTSAEIAELHGAGVVA
jgi:crotonobetainyl-CoA:carnitine CoA-transferase CaiB-like acyl-CoA transferase